MMDPLHQFLILPIFHFNCFGMDLSFTNSSLSVLIAVLLVFSFFLTGLRQKNLIPGRLQALVEMSYNLVAGLLNDNVGKEGLRYFPFVFSIFFFILFGNLIGMIPYMFTFTSHIIVTFLLAMVVFLFITILGLFLHGFHFFSLFMPKGASPFLAPILIPVEMISYLSRPISLSIRLFANMMVGHTMMKVFGGFVAMLIGVFGALAKSCKTIDEVLLNRFGEILFCLIPIGINVILTGFEIVIAIIQAYIFTVLTCVYLNDAVHLH